jgi:glutathione S-transferase
MITVYAAHNYPPVVQGVVRDLRALWALEELGTPYRIEWLDTPKGEHRSPEYRRINPFGKIPGMTDGELALFESGAMVNYLFDKAGKNPTSLADRAKNLAWCFAAVNTVEVQTFDIFLYDTFWKERPGRDQFRAERVENAKLRMNEMDAALDDKPYLTGSEIAPADIMMTTCVEFARAAPEIFAAAPRAAAWLKRCKQRPAYLRAAALQGTGPRAASAGASA